MRQMPEERELLVLQARLARLKITAEHLKMRQEQERQTLADAGLNTVIGVADSLPSGKLLWKSLFLPLKWKHRLLMAAALLLQAYRQSVRKGF